MQHRLHPAQAESKAAAGVPVARQLARDFTEQLGAYTAPGRATLLQLWQQGRPLPQLW